MLTLRRTQALLLGVLLLVVSVVLPAPAATAADGTVPLQTMYVSATSATVYAYPDVVTGGRMGTLRWGTKITVSPFITVDGTTTWYRVSAGRYIEASRLDPANPTDQTSVVRWSKSAWRYVVVRSGPGFWRPTVGKLGGYERVVGTTTSADVWIKLGEGRYVYKGAVSPYSNLAQLNGLMPTDQLCTLPSSLQGGGTSVRINCAVRIPLLMMNKAFYAKFGTHLNISNSYRAYDWQAKCYSQENTLCSAPGTSMHGWGMAVDFRGTSYAFDTPVDKWLTTYGIHYGWDRPVSLDKGSATPEYWHYNFVG